MAKQPGPVREFVIHNALYGSRSFFSPGRLRLDAVHSHSSTTGPKHLLRKLAERGVEPAYARPASPSGPGDEENCARHLVPHEDGEPRWVHRALERRPSTTCWHVRASRRRRGLITPTYRRCREKLAGPRSFAGWPFAFQGRADAYARAGPLARRAPRCADCFLCFIPKSRQGRQPARFLASVTEFRNRAEAVRGDRGGLICCCRKYPCCSMGRGDWVRAAPFSPSSSYFGQSWADAVRRGRREEFARFHGVPGNPPCASRIPDPIGRDTFHLRKLDLDEHRAGPPISLGLDWYRRCPGQYRARPGDCAAPGRESGQAGT